MVGQLRGTDCIFCKRRETLEEGEELRLGGIEGQVGGLGGKLVGGLERRWERG